MNELRTITRTSNWTPDRLRALSAIVVSADHVSDDPFGRAEGVVLDDHGQIQSFIVRSWENGLAARAVHVPLADVLWYTEGFTPALGITWTPEMLRHPPALPRGGVALHPALVVPGLATVALVPDTAPRPGAVRRALAIGMLGAAAGATLGAVLLDPLLAATLAMLLAPVAAALGGRRPVAESAVLSPPPPAREPWVALLEKNLLFPRTFERRVLHFSVLRPLRPVETMVLPASEALVQRPIVAAVNLVVATIAIQRSLSQAALPARARRSTRSLAARVQP